MNKHSTIVAASALIALATYPASAQTAPTVNKTWVSSTGTDTGSCQLVAPCKTFAYAISETNAGGEIDVKDSGAYGAFTITKSISIVADGVVASVGAGASNAYGVALAIDIESGPNDVVTLHGLTVDTHDVESSYDININCNSLIIIDRDIIQGSYAGIKITSATNVMISNNVITGNFTGVANYAGDGINLFSNIISGNNYGLYGKLGTYSNNGITANASCNTCGATLTKIAAE